MKGTLEHMDSDSHSDSQIKEIFQLKNIAVVGLSKNEDLIEYGYNVIPVNPTVSEVLGRKCYPSVAAINERIDVVDVFRKSEDIPAVIEDVLKKKDGIKVFWMQLGIYNEDAERKAKENGIDVVYNRCMMVEHERLFDDEE
jgi:predicted CoA-binding protein